MSDVHLKQFSSQRDLGFPLVAADGIFVFISTPQTLRTEYSSTCFSLLTMGEFYINLPTPATIWHWNCVSAGHFDLSSALHRLYREQQCSLQTDESLGGMWLV
jgi:hypothetical protein